MIEFAKVGAKNSQYQLSFAEDTYNTAVHLARQGMPVAFYSTLGIEELVQH